MGNPKASRSLLRRYLAAGSTEARHGQEIERGKWWSEPLVYGLAFGIPALLLAPWPWRPDAEFQAKIRTSAVSFTLGAYKGWGPFAGSDNLVDVAFEGLEKAELPDAEPWRARQGKRGGITNSLVGGAVSFKNVEFRQISAPRGTNVNLIWFDVSPTGVSMRLSYPASLSSAASQVIINPQSSVEFRSSLVSQLSEAQDGVIHVKQEGSGPVSIFAGDGGRLSVSITPRPLAAEPASRDTKIANDVLSSSDATLPLEERLPLLAGSRISFVDERHNESAILGDTSTVEVSNADRKDHVWSEQMLVIGDLREPTKDAVKKFGSPNVIGLEIRAKEFKDEKPGIYVTVRGTAGSLSIGGEDKRPRLPEWLKANKSLGLWLGLTLLIGNTLLTILTRANFFRLTGIKKP